MFKTDKSICWKCGIEFSDNDAEYCPSCGTLLCPHGHCLCNLSPEARVAVEREITSMEFWEYTSSGRRKKRKHSSSPEPKRVLSPEEIVERFIRGVKG
ncbi:MAG: hypothetical protein QXO00_02480 [Candidatus Bathyarchaeia archaeon]